MTIEFDSIPSGRRTPGRAIELNVLLAQAGLIATAAPRVLFIGQRTSDGTVAEKVLKQVYSDAKAKEFFGEGSTLAMMLLAAFKQHPNIRAEAIALDDSDTGVAADGEFQLSGTCTVAGTLRLWCGHRYVDVPVAVGDAAADVVDAFIASGSAELGDMPCTFADDSDNIDVTARNDGPHGNDIYLGYELLNGLTGISVTVVDMASGANYADPDDALGEVEAEHFDIIVLGGFEDSTELGKLKTHLDTVGAPLEMRGGFGVYATTGTLSAATTLAANFKTSYRMAAAFAKNAKITPWELAAQYAAAIAAETDLAMPLNNTELLGVDVPTAANRLTSTELETLLWAGVGPVVSPDGLRMRIVRTITTCYETAGGTPFEAMLDVQTLRVLEFVRYQLNAMFGSKFAKGKFTDELLDVVKGEVVEVLKAIERLEYLHQVDDNLDNVIVERNSVDQTQMDVRVPAVVVPGLHKIYTRVDYLETALTS